MGDKYPVQCEMVERFWHQGFGHHLECFCFPFENNTCARPTRPHRHTLSTGPGSGLPNKNRPSHETALALQIWLRLHQRADRLNIISLVIGWVLRTGYEISKAFLLPLFTSLQVTLPSRCSLLTQGHFQAAD